MVQLPMTIKILANEQGLHTKGLLAIMFMLHEDKKQQQCYRLGDLLQFQYLNTVVGASSHIMFANAKYWLSMPFNLLLHQTFCCAFEHCS